MQDRFKFRVWRRHNSGMLLKYIVGWEELPATAGSDVAPIEIVEQCTGLRDKNDQLIYEGDIVEEFNSGRIACIEFEEGGFCMTPCYEPRTLYELHRRSRLTVIGNVHENPELLTV